MKTIRYLFAIGAFLFLFGIMIVSAQTTNTPAVPAVAGDPVPFLHGLTGLYGMLVIAAGWAAHTNWQRILDAYEWVGAQGGVLGILRKFFIGSKKAVTAFAFLCSLCASAFNSAGADFTNTITFKALSASTNIAIIPFAKYDLSTHEIGYGAAGLYKVSDNFWTGLRVDRIDGRQTTAGVQAQLQQTFQLNGFTFTPFIEASVGLGSASLYGSAGPGAFIHLLHKDFKVQDHPVRLNIELIGDFEYVVFDGKKSNQVNGGPILELDF